MDLRVAAYAVITDDLGRVLLAHWSEAGMSGWTMPGGGMEPGEDPADTARREVTEETGFVVELDELIGIDSRIIPAARRTGSSAAQAATPLQAIRIVYTAHIVGGDLRNEINGTTDEAGWFSLEQISQLQRVSLVDVSLRFAGLID